MDFHWSSSTQLICILIFWHLEMRKNSESLIHHLTWLWMSRSKWVGDPDHESLTLINSWVSPILRKSSIKNGGVVLLIRCNTSNEKKGDLKKSPRPQTWILWARAEKNYSSLKCTWSHNHRLEHKYGRNLWKMSKIGQNSMKNWPFFAIILPWMASYGPERSLLLIFSARDDLVKVSWKSDAWKCQNQHTPPYFDQLSERRQPLWSKSCLPLTTNFRKIGKQLENSKEFKSRLERKI